MLRLILSFFWWFTTFFRSRHDLGFELVALRQQVSVLRRKNARPRLGRWDRLFWVTLRKLWSRWAEVLVVVKPETVVGWHRAGFRLYWRLLSRRTAGRPAVPSELRQLIQRMARENPIWGAPRIHGELLKLGLEVSERTVSRYLARLGLNGDSGQRWLTFLKNHREVMAAMDFFTVPTATFRVLYCFFVISHGRRRILHFNATEHPTSEWIVQQLREAFPEDSAPRYLILDRDRKYEGEATEMLRSLGSKLIQIVQIRSRPLGAIGQQPFRRNLRTRIGRTSIARKGPYDTQPAGPLRRLHSRRLLGPGERQPGRDVGGMVLLHERDELDKQLAGFLQLES
jgi:putative transposase